MMLQKSGKVKEQITWKTQTCSLFGSIQKYRCCHPHPLVNWDAPDDTPSSTLSCNVLRKFGTTEDGLEEGWWSLEEVWYYFSTNTLSLQVWACIFLSQGWTSYIIPGWWGKIPGLLYHFIVAEQSQTDDPPESASFGNGTYEYCHVYGFQKVPRIWLHTILMTIRDKQIESNRIGI